MIRALIFDCYGVIFGQGFNRTYEMAGGDPKKDRDFIKETLTEANLGKISNDQFVDRMISKLKINLKNWAGAVKKSEYPDERLLTFIKNAKTKYKTAILSNANLGSVRRELEGRDLKDYFDEIIISAEEGLIKPDPDIFKLAAKRLGVKPSECLFIDDSRINALAAEAVGMKALHYLGYEDFIKKVEHILN